MPPRRRTPPRSRSTSRRCAENLTRARSFESASAGRHSFPKGARAGCGRSGDPAVDGEEYVQVELSLNGTRDILPFTPADLTPATRAAARAKAVPSPPQRTKPTRPGRRCSDGRSDFGRPQGRRQPSQADSGDPLGSVMAGPPRAAAIHPAPPALCASRSAGTERIADRTVGGPGQEQPRRCPAGGKNSPPVTITIATTDSEPTAVADRGPRRRAGGAPFRNGVPCAGLGAGPTTRGPDVDHRRSVESWTNNGSAAQARADALAAELAQVRAELEALPERTADGQLAGVISPDRRSCLPTGRQAGSGGVHCRPLA